MSDPTQQSQVFGQMLVKLGFLTDAQLAEFMRQLDDSQPSLGGLLIQRGILTPSQVQQLLQANRTGGDASAVLATRGLAANAAPAPRFGPPPASPARPGSAPTGGPPPGFENTPRVPSARPGPVASGPARPVPTPPGGASSVASIIAPGSMTPASRPIPTPPELQTPPVHLPPAPSMMTPGPSISAGAGPTRVPAILEAAERKGASDVHFHPTCPPAMRVEGRLGLVNQPVPDVEEHARQLLAILNDDQRRQFEETNDLDFSYVTPGGLRTRANMYRSQLGIDATFRILRRQPQSLEELGLPPVLAKFTQHHQGLVLVTGPAGCGKSTTLAALIDLIAQDRPDHVLIVEDPIEIVHPEKRALVNQRQVGRDTESFARALRGALREDPDVIVIGELRDRESISLAVTAAETGHLVLGSMHTNSAARTIARLVDAFPPNQQAQVRSMLSESLRGVVTQKLVPGTDGKRIPAVEVLVVTPAIGNLVREGKLFQIKSAMQTGKSIGMRSMDDSLRELVLAGRVSPEEARKHAESAAAIPSAAAPPPPPTQPPTSLPPSSLPGQSRAPMPSGRPAGPSSTPASTPASSGFRLPFGKK